MKTKAFLSGWCYFFCMVVIAQPAFNLEQSGYSKEEKDVITIVVQIYDEISSDGEKEVDWEKVRSFFVEEAIIVLRIPPYDSKQFTVNEFIRDFKEFYQNTAVQESGFKEEVLKVQSQVYKDIAFIGVIYSAYIPNSANPPHKGIDFWLLSRRDNTWKVIAVNNEIIPSKEDIPEWFDPVK
jgi:hypothetical protein